MFVQHLPTLNEVVDGLFQQFCSTLQQVMDDGTAKQSHVQKQIYRQVFDYVVQCVGLADPDEPFRIDGGGEQDLANPYSKAACLTLFFYSIEPPFYAYLNKAIRSRDPKEAKALGPFASALYQVITRAESYREDRETPGNIVTADKQLFSFQCSLGHFEGSFLAFKGT